MSKESKQAAAFLGMVSEFVWGDSLYRGQQSIWTKLVRRGLSPTRPGANVTILSRYKVDDVEYKIGLLLGTSVELAPEKRIEFASELLAHDDGWIIETFVLLDLWPAGEGQKSLRTFPKRQARTRKECEEQLQAAALDLATCDDVIDEIAPADILPASKG